MARAHCRPAMEVTRCAVASSATSLPAHQPSLSPLFRQSPWSRGGLGRHEIPSGPITEAGLLPAPCGPCRA